MMRAILLGLMGLMIGVAGCSPAGAETKPSRKTTRSSASQKSKAATDSQSAPAAPQKTETAVFAGGCFWCTEYAFEQLAGVVNVESGYCGGTQETASYDWVKLGITDHAEAIRVTYDTSKLTYADLLGVFFDSHDPTQVDRQGVDEGRQYRSAIFFANDEQEQQAKDKIADLEAKRVYKRRIATKLEPLKEFYPAEDYHQDFARRNMENPYIQEHSVPKMLRVRKKHADLIRKNSELFGP